MIDPAELLGKEIHKNVIFPGKGDIPSYDKDTKATFHFRVFLNNQERLLLDDSKSWNEPFELLIGHEFQLECWEKAIQSMRPGERAEFACSPEKCMPYAKLSKTLRDIQKKKLNKDAAVAKSCCGTQTTGYCDLDKITGESLIFEFDLLSVQQPGNYKKEIWTMSVDEKKVYAQEQREKGNNYYKAKNLSEAEKSYAQAIGALEQLALAEKPQSEEWNEIEDLKLPCLLNYSQVKLSQLEYCEAVKHLNTVLKRDPDNVKGLYRRGKAHAGCWNIEEAEADWTRLAEVDPSQSSMVTKEMAKLQLAVKKKQQDEKNRLKGMF